MPFDKLSILFCLQSTEKKDHREVKLNEEEHPVSQNVMMAWHTHICFKYNTKEHRMIRFFRLIEPYLVSGPHQVVNGKKALIEYEYKHKRVKQG
ncbi:hypothetical protein L5515_008743 [Caenorhabditis briggsae]|uniref:Uncharacterized protein n=1 Tax=Caenorhabditis briggsae TaxID=6238 RepID=A0AAE9F717_CAEBR|nr:hypothetical protein L5515_008743 [Caenorhabditis briggsae]